MLRASLVLLQTLATSAFSAAAGPDPKNGLDVLAAARRALDELGYAKNCKLLHPDDILADPVEQVDGTVTNFKLHFICDEVLGPVNVDVVADTLVVSEVEETLAAEEFPLVLKEDASKFLDFYSCKGDQDQFGNIEGYSVTFSHAPGASHGQDARIYELDHCTGLPIGECKGQSFACRYMLGPNNEISGGCASRAAFHTAMYLAMAAPSASASLAALVGIAMANC